MSKIIFEPPAKNEPGFLRRQRKVMEFKQLAKDGDESPELLDAMIETLLPFVKEPADRTEAYEALEDASEEQFNQLLTLISGGADNSANPPGKKRASKSGSKGQSA